MEDALSLIQLQEEVDLASLRGLWLVKQPGSPWKKKHRREIFLLFQAHSLHPNFAQLLGILRSCEISLHPL